MLSAYNQAETRHLGRLLARAKKIGFVRLGTFREEGFFRATGFPSRHTATTNALLHYLGHFMKQISQPEKAHFLDSPH